MLLNKKIQLFAYLVTNFHNIRKYLDPKQANKLNICIG